MHRILAVLAVLLVAPAALAGAVEPDDALDPLSPSPRECLASGRIDAPLHCVPSWIGWACEHVGLTCPVLPLAFTA